MTNSASYDEKAIEILNFLFKELRNDIDDYEGI
jgi:hypothetical protein